MPDQDKNKQIVKNTAFLYIRMLFILFIGLYTSRVILSSLGIVDYGINAVVGGVVSMFSIVGGALSGAISRFITYELGRKNSDKLKVVFSTSVTIQIIMSVIAFVLLEVFGLWFLNNKMTIPELRLEAANWVFQSAVISFILNLLSVPYNAEIIAHEKMNAFAYISISEAILKLIIVLVLFISPFDRLKLYSILLLGVSLFIRFLYGFYCSKNFEECHFHFIFDKQLVKQMGSFAGWTFFSGAGSMLCTEGVSVLINIYFGVIVNSARGIVVQVDAVVKSFINNFTTAVSPQIMKSYAQGELDYMLKLAYSSSKITSYLMILVAVPIIIEAPIILNLWLGKVPEFSVVFLRWTLLTSFFDTALIISFRDCINATGKIKIYQLATTLLLWTMFPIIWITYKLGSGPVSGYIVNFITALILMFVRLIIVVRTLRFPIVLYLKTVLSRVVFIFLVSYSFSFFLSHLMQEGILRLLLVLFSNTCITLWIIYLWGLTETEKNILRSKIVRLFAKASH